MQGLWAVAGEAIFLNLNAVIWNHGKTSERPGVWCTLGTWIQDGSVEAACTFIRPTLCNEGLNVEERWVLSNDDEQATNNGAHKEHFAHPMTIIQ